MTTCEFCADCGANLTDLRPIYRVPADAGGEVRLCGGCAEARGGILDQVIVRAEAACLQADTHREPVTPKPRVPGSCARSDCDSPADPDFPASAKLCPAHAELLRISVAALEENR